MKDRKRERSETGTSEREAQLAREPEPSAGAAEVGRTPAEETTPGSEPAEEGEGPSERVTERLSREIERELAELDELRDRHLRLAAEFENYRKRTRREQMELRTTAQADLVQGLLESLDDVARMAATPPDSATVESLLEGMQLIHRKLRKTLEDAGLTRIEAEGSRFDPAIHEAVAVTEVTDPERDETVSRVLAEGYRFRDRLVRPARVEVARYVGEGAEEPAGEA